MRYRSYAGSSVWLAALCLGGAGSADGAGTAAQEAAPAQISYTLPRDGRISLLVQNSEGKVVRELLHAAPRKQGLNSEPWDCLDEVGQPLPAGKYSWKLLSTQGLHAEFVTRLGTNPAPAWESWPANHNGLAGIAADESGLYLGGPGEGTPTLLKQDYNGKRLWTLDHWLQAWAGPLEAATAGGRSFHLQGDGKLQVLDAATGVPTVTWDLLYPGADYSKPPTWIGIPDLLDIAGRGDHLVASYANKDAVRWLDTATGKPLDEAAVPEPTGICVDKTGRVYTISKGSVVTLTREDKIPRPVVAADQLQGAWRLDVDWTNGDILVAESNRLGASSHQVKRFSKTGKLLATYGQKGGRRAEGLYDSGGFSAIHAIVATPDGGFVVAEPWGAPRRTARFDKDGKLLNEWFGGQMYANFGCPDPDDPTLVWIDGPWGSILQVKVDYATKSWKVRAAYNFQGLADGLVTGTVHGSGRWFVRKHGGATYLVREGTPCILRVDETAGHLVPLVAARQNIVVPWNADPWGGAASWLKAMLNNDPKTPMHSYFWMDANGDGKPQQDEMHFSTFSSWWGGYHTDIDFNLYCTGQDKDGKGIIAKWAVQSWTASGVPLYPEWDKFEIIGSVPRDAGSPALWKAADGTLYGASNMDGNKFGQGFWSARTGGNRVSRYDTHGKSLWVVGQHAAGSTPLPGEGKYFYRIVGTTHDCVVVGDVEVIGHVWDKDGLWVGRLLEDPDLKAAPAWVYQLRTENFSGTLYEDPKTHDVLYYGGDTNNTPVYRVTGWNEFQRQSGSLELTPAMVDKLTARVTQERAREDIAHVVTFPELGAIDGNLKEWQKFKPMIIKDGEEVVAKVWVGWNHAGLVAAFDVTTESPWQTAADNQLAFQGGASVGLSLGQFEPKEGRRTAPAPGDMRVVAARVGGKDTLVCFMPKATPEMGSSRTQPTYQTNNGKVTFDRVEALAGQVVSKMKDDNSGYTVEMQIPSGFTGLAPERGQKLLLDAYVALAFPKGNGVQARLPWNSRDAGDMANNDVYTEALLRPQNWAEAHVE